MVVKAASRCVFFVPGTAISPCVDRAARIIDAGLSGAASARAAVSSSNKRVGVEISAVALAACLGVPRTAISVPISSEFTAGTDISVDALLHQEGSLGLLSKVQWGKPSTTEARCWPGGE